MSLSLALSNNFAFNFFGDTELKAEITSVALPGINSDVSSINYGGLENPTISSGFLKEQINIEFMVDAEFKNYLYIYQWMLSAYDPQQGFKVKFNDIHGNLKVYNSDDEEIFSVIFENLIPTSINEILFSTADSSNITGLVSFAYSNAKFNF